MSNKFYSRWTPLLQTIPLFHYSSHPNDKIYFTNPFRKEKNYFPVNSPMSHCTQVNYKSAEQVKNDLKTDPQNIKYNDNVYSIKRME